MITIFMFPNIVMMKNYNIMINKGSKEDKDMMMIIFHSDLVMEVKEETMDLIHQL